VEGYVGPGIWIGGLYLSKGVGGGSDQELVVWRWDMVSEEVDLTKSVGWGEGLSVLGVGTLFWVKGARFGGS